MDLTASNVKAVMTDSLYRTEEVTDGATPDSAVIAKGIMIEFGFHPERLEARRKDVAAMLDNLEPIFRQDIGGGYTFMNMVLTKKGVQWGEQTDAECLLALGLGLGYMRYCSPREVWPMLPGGMPYVVYSPDGFEDLGHVATPAHMRN